ncbi:hypothetical protein [Allokutzneria sp. NRRL B-24872]|uniref:hypothetical protein n=1 Tax=Allokutzneria sp. NRRL B-24872 TaxID=1137961 RepID=UPI000A39AE71|nr:hypothetical protein [Allokutzneria sp. NRRL B-24872]
MTGSSNPRYRAAFDALAHALLRCEQDRVTGTVNLVGAPGAVVHLRRGAVIAVRSPGAPGAEVLLVRSGRISEADWTRARRAGPEHPSRVLAHGGVGATELRTVTMMAAHDGAFAAVTGTVEDCFVDDRPTDPPLPVTNGIDLAWLFEQTSRRLKALAALPFAVSPHRDRLGAAHGADLATTVLTAAQREVLAQVVGRRSARDIAFTLGRGLYPVTIEVCRMLGDGLVEVVAGASPAAVSLARAVAPRTRPGRAAIAFEPERRTV